MRMILRAHYAMWAATSDDFVIGTLWAVDEGSDCALTGQDSACAAQMLQAAGGVDFFNAIRGLMDMMRSLAMKNMPGSATPIAPWAEHIGRFNRVVGLPFFHAARVSDPASARHAVAEGYIDMADVTRGQIADPHLVTKLAASSWRSSLWRLFTAGFCLRPPSVMYPGICRLCI
jgi:2,4-dienoyl-CoA reductase-like NADH-dependent reductase (Old Yellow Enzyme family)